MGSTRDGADWAIKALDPSNERTEVRGIPDMSAGSTICMNYQTVATLSPSAGATGTWSFEATLLPHPVDFMSITAHDSVLPDWHQNILNSQMSGADHQAKMEWLLENAQQWRLAYAGVTVVQDGPDLANQGTMVVCQAPVQSYEYSACVVDPVLDPAVGGFACSPKIQIFGIDDQPNFDTSQAMPGAYFNQSKFGAYVPLKLTKTCQEWTGQRDIVTVGFNAQENDFSYLLPKSGAYSWPHWDVLTLAARTDVQHGIENSMATSPFLNELVAHICAKNLAVTTSFSFFFRYGIEYRVMPDSTMSPQLKLAPRYDAMALDMYYAVSRELKDAFPSDYNDLGKLWTVISGVVRDVTPYISKLGRIGGLASGVATSVVDLGDAIYKKRQKQRAKKPAPLKVPGQKVKKSDKVNFYAVQGNNKK